ncbi:DNRLRE domain-containing protein [Bacillus carboniphilus]|uniref:DNRLRE domain-containing protein n=1 Tax=Bacillus carboniphilus TaxID=86663 RepID=A0ABY9JT19_9BACI|nr:DNRLRE domain-containing protein [Bacillus carboniphilus]WLR42507.1 DNRLRE domain-containing protein [Bacillus carboniphilus]
MVWQKPCKKNNETKVEESDQQSSEEEVKMEDLETIPPVDLSQFEGFEAGEEIIDMRTETSKFFYNGDGTIKEEVYLEPVHKKEEGEESFEDISTDLVEDSSDENKLETENTFLDTTFLKEMKNGEYATFESEGYSLTHSLIEASGEEKETLKVTDVEAVFEENTITHQNVFPSIDLQNIAFARHTKEYLILNSYEGYHQFTFKVKTDLQAQLTDHGEIDFIDDKDKVIFSLPKPFMEDSNFDEEKGEYLRSEAVEFSLEETENGYFIGLEADSEWLLAPERQYPVYIDPTVKDLGIAEDAFVMSKYGNENYSTPNDKHDKGYGETYLLKIGYYDSTTKTCYAFIKPQTNGFTVGNGWMTQKAQLKVYVTHSSVSYNTNLWLDRVDKSWSAGSITWNERPSSTNIGIVSVGKNQWATFDVTSTVKEWNKGTRPNYGFKLHSNGNGKSYWKKIVSAIDSSNKKPRLEITHTPLGTAKAPKVTAHSSGKNTGTGYFNLSWDKIAGATHYKVAIYNGEEYQYFDVGTSTSWSTKGKGIWPTTSEIKDGKYSLHGDEDGTVNGTGAELPNSPNSTYIASGGKYKDNHNYWFRVIGYNKEYDKATNMSGATMPTLPDSTRPNQPQTPTAMIVNESKPNSGDQVQASVKWKSVSDLPEDIASGIDYYALEKKVNGSWSSVAKVKHTGSNDYEYTVTGLPDQSSVAFRVAAVDKNQNTSGFSESHTLITPDRTRPSAPTTVSIEPSTWSNNQDYVVSWEGIKDSGYLANIQYRIDSGAWKNLGTTNESGSKKLSEELTDGIHTVHIQGIDREGNTSYSKSATIYKDTSAPAVSLLYPKANQTVDGIENIRMIIENPIPRTNLIHNGDFISGLSGWSESRYYDTGVIYTSGSVNNSDKDEEVTEPEEKISLKIDPDSSSSEWGYIASTSSFIEVKPNTTYKLMGDIQTDLQKAHAFFNIEVLEENKQWYWVDSRDTSLSGVQGWTNHEITFTTSSEAQNLKVYLEVEHEDANAKGTAWFDSIRLVEVNKETNTLSSTNLIYNGDFSKGLDGWGESRKYDEGVISSSKGTDSFDKQEGDAPERVTLKINPDSSSPGAEWGYIASTYVASVKPNTTYTLSGDIKTELEKAHAFFNIEILTENPNSRLYWIDDGRDQQLEGIHPWTSQTITFTTPNDASNVRIYLEVEHTDANAKGTAWFDSIRLEEVNETLGEYQWSLAYGQEDDPSSFTEIQSGTSQSSDLSYAWDTSLLEDQTNYTLKLTATDAAGNQTVKTTNVVKTRDTSSIEPSIDILSPEKGSVITRPSPHLDFLVNNLSLFTDENMLRNGSFDETIPDVKEGTEQPKNWTLSVQGGSATTGVFDASNGRISVLSFESLMENPAWNWGSASYSQWKTIEPNTTYKVSGDLFDEVDDVRGSIFVDLYKGSTFVESIKVDSTAAFDMEKNEWVQHEKVFTTSDDITGMTVRLQVEGQSKGPETTLAFDNISLVKAMDQFETDVFINSKKVNTEEQPTANILFDATNYVEGSTNHLYIRTKDAEGSFDYSTYAYRTNGLMDTFEDQEKVENLLGVQHDSNQIHLLESSQTGSFESKAMTFAGNISTIYFNPTEEKPAGTDIAYEASADGGDTWEFINPKETTALTHTGTKLKIRATLTSSSMGVTPTLQAYESEVVYVNPNGHSFEVHLIDQPEKLTATSNVNYMTLLRWESSKTADVTYRIYRSKEKGFSPSSETMVADQVKEPFWNDYNLNFGETFYYKVVSVKEFNGKPRESLPTNEAWASVVDEEELNKRLGLQDYWGYSTFPTAHGDGYINISSGNLVYQTTDFVTVSPQLAKVMRRTFNSQSTTKTPLGYGWDFSFNTALLKEFDKNGKEVGLILKDGDGSLHRFVKNEQGTYDTPKGIHMTLTQNQDGSVDILRKDQVSYHFDTQLKLRSLSEPNGNQLTFKYNDRGNVEQVISGHEEGLLEDDITYFYYNKDDLLKTVIDHAGREYTFEYKDFHRLREVWQLVNDNQRYAEEYEYNDDNELDKLIDAEGYETELTYKEDRLERVTDPVNEYSTFLYEENKTTMTSDQGKKVTFTYNEDGNIQSKTDPSNHTVHFEYTDQMLVEHMYYDNTFINEENEESKIITKTLHHWYTYDDRGNIETVEDPLGNVTHYQDYNDRNLVGKIIEPVRKEDGVTVTATTSYEYDDKGNLEKTVDPEGRTISYTYDDIGNQETMTNEFGHTTTYKYDSKGRVQKIIEPLNKVTEIVEYDEQGNPKKIKDPKGNITESKYDLLDRLVKTTDAKGNTIERNYDLTHNLDDVTDAKGYLTDFEYDEVGRLKTTTHPNGNVDSIHYDYDDEGNEKITYTDGENRTITKYYDEVGRLAKEEAAKTVTSYEYDLIGNMTKVTDGEGRVVESRYDELSRQTHVITDPSGKNIVTSSVFDLQGNVLHSIDGEGYQTDYQYDRLNRLKTVTQMVDEKPLTTSYDYDIEDGEFIKNKVTDAMGREKVTYLDALGQVRKEVDEGDTSDSERMVKTFTYDLNGNLVETIYNDDSVVEHKYNELNQLVEDIYGEDHYTNYHYDDNGNRETMINVQDGEKITTSYAYDTKGRLTQEVQEGSAITYAYDASDNVIHLSYPKEEGDQQQDIEYNYDDYNRLESIVVEGQTAQGYTYNDAGQVGTIKNYLEFDTEGSNYTVVDYAYNTAGMTETISYKKSGETTLEEFTMFYDNRGYVEEETIDTNYDQSKTVKKTYKYDSVGRLDHSTVDDKLTSYTYDGVGNRKTMTEDSDSYVYTYNQFNQLKTTTKNGKAHASYEYDKRGNQKVETIKKEIDDSWKDVQTTYTYNLANELTKVETNTPGSDISVTKNYYNGDGQRIRRDVNRLTEKYYYFDDALLYSTDKDNQKVTENILNPSGLIAASKRFDGVYENNYFFYHYDLRGSVTNIIDSDAKRVKGYEYDDFGNPKEVGDKTFKNDVKFTGSVHDASTGLHYMNARYYSPDTGRFISQDTYKGSPFDPWTQHLYTYTTNNPVNFVDPTGHYHASPDGSKILTRGSKVIPPNKPTPPSNDNGKNKGGSNGPKKNDATKPTTKKSGEKSFWKKVSNVAHQALDYAGYAPGLGQIASGVDAALYAFEGDYKNAAISATGMIPGAKYVTGAAKGLRFAAKGLDKMTPKQLTKTSIKGLRENLPKGWKMSENGPNGNDFVHIKDLDNNYRIRVDPPDKVTKYDHMHVYDKNGNSLDINGNSVDYKSPDAHLPYNRN